MDNKSFNEYMTQRSSGATESDRTTRWGIAILAILLIVLIGGFFWYNNRTASFMASSGNTDENKGGFFSQLFKPSGEDTAAAPADSDGDGLADNEEVDAHTNSRLPDSDNDGLNDREEVRVYKTDPNKSDSDSDGKSDSEEIAARRDPLNPAADAPWPPRPEGLSVK